MAFFKVRPERDSIIVTAAQAAVVVQSSVLDEIKDELARTQKHFQDELDAMAKRIESVTAERDAAVAEADVLRKRVDELEAQSAGLAAEVEKLKLNGPTGPRS